MNNQCSHRVPELSHLPAERVTKALGGTAQFFFLTGRAGTGKSTVIQHIRRLWPKSTAIIAPTGIAALNAGGQTLHSFFSLPPRATDPYLLKVRADERLLRKIELLIIDEISMVRADVLDAADTILRRTRDEPWTPFGGVRILAVGDLFQLPPVVSSSQEKLFLQSRYNSPFFFDAHCFDQGVPLEFIELNTVYRQSDPTFTSVLDTIREGEYVDDAITYLNERCYRQNDSRSVTLASTNKRAEITNRKHLKSLKGESKTYTGVISGEFNMAIDRLPSPWMLELKEGAQVMFTRNHHEGLWVNGSLGSVVSLSNDDITVSLHGSQELCLVERTTWENARYTFNDVSGHLECKPAGTYTQFPLVPAWAVTIHKAQGLTLDEALIDLGSGAFAHGQTYVALSRVRSLDGLSLSRPLTLRDIYCDPAVKQFHNTNRTRQ